MGLDSASAEVRPIASNPRSMATLLTLVGTRLVPESCVSPSAGNGPEVPVEEGARAGLAGMGLPGIRRLQVSRRLLILQPQPPACVPQGYHDPAGMEMVELAGDKGLERHGHSIRACLGGDGLVPLTSRVIRLDFDTALRSGNEPLREARSPGSLRARGAKGNVREAQAQLPENFVND